MRNELNTLKPALELISEYKSLKHQIKILEKHAEVVRQQLIDHYLINTDTIYCPDGLEICTYKASIRCTFQTAKFHLEHPLLYADYLDIKEIKTFLVK